MSDIRDGSDSEMQFDKREMGNVIRERAKCETRFAKAKRDL